MLVNGEGFHKTFEECQASQSERTNAYARLTGQAIIASYCHAETRSLVSSHPYVLHIDSAGRGTGLNYYATNLVLGDHFVGDREQYIQSVKQRMSSIANMKIDQVIVRSATAGFIHLSFSYYSSKRLAFDMLPRLKFSDPRHCQAELQGLQEFSSEAGTTVIAAACVSLQYSRATEAISYTLQGGAARFFDTRKEFASYDQCNAKKAEILAEFQQNLGDSAKGVICTSDARGALAFVVLGR